MAAPARIDELRHQYAAQPRRYLAPLANALRRSGAYEEAVTMLRAQLAEYPDHLTGFVVLGQALFDTGALVESREAFEAARALDPGNRVVLHHLGEIASLAGDAAGARVWFGRLRAADPYADDVAAQFGGAGEPPAPYGDELGDAATEGIDVAQEVAAHDASASDSFELLEFEPGAFDVAASPAEPPLDPVVGLDLAPAELRPELDAVGDDGANASFLTSARGADTEHEDATDALEHITAGPFATETMAGLLAAQGHTEQALAIYERLAAERPDDPALRARVDALRGAPQTADDPGHATAVAPPVRAAATDTERGALLAAAFADVSARAAAVRAQTASDNAPVETATGALSDAPDPFRAATADADPFADVSFDHFFADAESVAKPEAAPAEPPSASLPGHDEPDESDDDLARFDAWLRGTAVDGGRVSRS